MSVARKIVGNPYLTHTMYSCDAFKMEAILQRWIKRFVNALSMDKIRMICAIRHEEKSKSVFVQQLRTLYIHGVYSD